VNRDKQKRTKITSTDDTDPSRASIEEFLSSKLHPLEREIHLVRRTILGVDASIREEIKWNSVSFRNDRDFFATVNLRSTDSVQVILYTGVKKKATAEAGVQIDDPCRLIEKWPAKDRCIVTLGKGARLKDNLSAFTALVRHWTQFVR
jgi:hypothetical protein